MSETAILFGDIHNHNACGYGIGSMERTIEIARSHLDFFAFTGHSSWHDMVPMEGGREQHWLQGFERLREAWPRVQDLIADANRADGFAAFLGFEWHSSQFGDQCVVFPDDHQPVHYTDDVADLRRFCLAKNALMIPHHLAYPQGHRGVNWQVFDESCTPVVEVFSEHGNSEHDRGAFDFFSHSMGGRETAQTVRSALAQGLRFGFVASSDSHRGFPGAYGEGLLGVHSAGHDRESIMEAIRARRTWAITGDRIEIDFTVDGAPMGSTIEAGGEVEVAYDIRGRDELDVVEVIHDGRIVHRSHPGPAEGPADLGPVFQTRIEWGWGPWGDLSLDRVCDWRFRVSAEAGRIARVFPCFQSGPFDETRRHAVSRTPDGGVAVRSFTSRAGAYRQNPNQALVLEIEGDMRTSLTLALSDPVEQVVRATVADLARGSVTTFTGPFPKESHQLRRIAPLAATTLRDRCTLRVPDGRSHVYLRVRQANGHIAWVSPVFMNYR